MKGLVFENTFTSIDDLIDFLIPLRQFQRLNRNLWNSLEGIAKAEV